MPIDVEQVSDAQAEKLLQTDEGQFSDVKGIDIAPARLTKFISAFANTDGGDLYIGIAELDRDTKIREWRGFSNQEAANGHLQIFEELFPLGTDFQYEFLTCGSKSGVVLHAQVNKTRAIMVASNKIPYIRRGAQSLPLDTPEKLKRLEYAKGITSFETEIVPSSKEVITTSEVVKAFIADVVPTAEPEPWLKKQVLLRDDQPTVAGLLLFADEPQAIIPNTAVLRSIATRRKRVKDFVRFWSSPRRPSRAASTIRSS